MTLIRPLAATAAVALALASVAASAQKPIANIGTLTCVASPASKEPLGVERELSCTFASISGANATMTGTVKRLGAQVSGQAKIVPVWSVLAPDISTPASQLEGRYVGNLGVARDEEGVALVDGNGGSIALRPLTAAPEVGNNAALSVLELQVSAMRA